MDYKYDLLKKFPNIKLSYEPLIHSKVFCDQYLFNSTRFILIINIYI